MKLRFNSKRIFSLFLALVLLFAFTLSGCDKNEKAKVNKPKKEETTQTEANEEISSDDLDLDLDFDEDFDLGDIDLGDLDLSLEDPYAEVTVSNNTPVQKNMLGIGGIYHGFSFITNENNANWAYTDEMLSMEVDRVVQSGARIVRTYYSPSYGFDYTTNTWDWNSTAMQQFYKYCQTMKDNGIKVLINAGWGYGDIKAENCRVGYSGKGTAKNPFYILSGGSNDDCEKYFYQWIVDSVKALDAQKLDNAMYFTFFTESGTGYVERDSDQEYIDAIVPVLEQNLKIDEALKNAGVRDKIKVVGPNTVDYDGLTQLRYVVETKKYFDCFDILSHHQYLTGEYTSDSYVKWYYGVYSEINSIVKSTGKELWIDEWGYKSSNLGYIDYQDAPDPLHGTQIALGTVAGLNSGAQTMLFWSLVNQYWHGTGQTGGEWKNGVQITGIVPIIQTSTIPFPAYYAYSMIGRYLYGDNIKVYEGMDDDGIYLTACQLPDGNWTVIVVNMNSQSKIFRADFDKAINTKLYRHLYDPNSFKATVSAKPIGADKTFNKISTTFADELPPYGVAVYTSVKK